MMKSTLVGVIQVRSKEIPIPRFQPRDNSTVNFVGRLARELMRLTSPSTAVYLENSRAWFDIKSQTEVVNVSILQVRCCMDLLF